MKNPADNPYQVGLAPSPHADGDFVGQFYSIKKDQDLASRAPAELPFPLQTVVNKIGNVFVDLVDIRDSFHQAKALSDKPKNYDQLERDIDEITQKLCELTNRLYDVKLGDD